MPRPGSSPGVITAGEVPAGSLVSLLSAYGLRAVCLSDGADITGSYWGEPEAGIVGREVYFRPDTPVHSLLHEAGHTICMSSGRRATLDRDAGGDDLEEAAVCYLQIVLADEIPAVGRNRLMRDMDRWGYSFRLGSTARWFAEDAGDARNWLIERGLLQTDGRPVFRLRD